VLTRPVPNEAGAYVARGSCRVHGGKGKHVIYEKPTVVDYGSITDHTFQTPGGVKGCQTNCHLDSFNEQSALPVSA
jgi:hypothetical protein